MKRHTITEAELNDWVAEHWVQFAASFGGQSSKRLEVTFGGLYRVTDHGAVTYTGDDKATAIREYNDAR